MKYTDYIYLADNSPITHLEMSYISGRGYVASLFTYDHAFDADAFDAMVKRGELKMKMSDKTRRELFALGRNVWGQAWDAKRPAYVFWITRKKQTSAKCLTQAQGEAIINALRVKQAKRQYNYAA